MCHQAMLSGRNKIFLQIVAHFDQMISVQQHSNSLRWALTHIGWQFVSYQGLSRTQFLNKTKLIEILPINYQFTWRVLVRCHGIVKAVVSLTVLFLKSFQVHVSFNLFPPTSSVMKSQSLTRRWVSRQPSRSLGSIRSHLMHYFFDVIFQWRTVMGRGRSMSYSYLGRSWWCSVLCYSHYY